MTLVFDILQLNYQNKKVNLTKNIQQLHEINTVVLNLKVMPHYVTMQHMSQDHPFISMSMRNYNEYELDRNLNKYYRKSLVSYRADKFH
jgi:hypothetical protein